MLKASLLDIPRPFIDPIDTLVEALGVACLSLPRPLAPHTVVLVADAHRRCVAMLHCPPLDETSIHTIVGHCAHVPDACNVVFVSVRVTPPICSSDPELLQHCMRVTASAGLQLFDWVVVGVGGLYCPRSLTDSSDPWTTSVSCL